MWTEKLPTRKSVDRILDLFNLKITSFFDGIPRKNELKIGRNSAGKWAQNLTEFREIMSRDNLSWNGYVKIRKSLVKLYSWRGWGDGCVQNSHTHSNKNKRPKQTMNFKLQHHLKQLKKTHHVENHLGHSFKNRMQRQNYNGSHVHPYDELCGVFSK